MNKIRKMLSAAGGGIYLYMKKMKKREREAIDAYIKAKEKEREAEYKEWLKLSLDKRNIFVRGHEFSEYKLLPLESKEGSTYIAHLDNTNLDRRPVAYETDNLNLEKEVARVLKNPIETPLNVLPEVVVTGYRPIKLETYYPLGTDYPYTGHSQLTVPITDKVARELELIEDGSLLSKKLVVDKQSDADDYNLVTNNCANATLGCLNTMFGTDESPYFFTTPGDVRDYAIKTLKGKRIKVKLGDHVVDTVLIPRDASNADELSRKALSFRNQSSNGTSYMENYYYKKGGVLIINGVKI